MSPQTHCEQPGELLHYLHVCNYTFTKLGREMKGHIARVSLGALALAALVVALIGMFAAPALGWHAVLEGRGACDELSWEWKVTWTLSEPGEKWGIGYDMVVISDTRDLFTGATVAHGDSVQATEVVEGPGVYEMDLVVGWTDSTETSRHVASVTLEGTCAPGQPASLPLTVVGFCRSEDFVVEARVSDLVPGEPVVIAMGDVEEEVVADDQGGAVAEFTAPVGPSEVTITAATDSGRRAEEVVSVEDCREENGGGPEDDSSSSTSPTVLAGGEENPQSASTAPVTVLTTSATGAGGPSTAPEATRNSVAPQVVGSTPETLPLTGFSEQGVGGIGTVLVVVGLLAALAARGREAATATVVSRGWYARLKHYDLRFWDH